MEGDKEREFSRATIPLRVTLSFADGTTVEGQAADVSLNGARLLTDARPEVGAPCDVTMAFGEEEDGLLLLHTEAEVVRHHSDGVAVQHTAISLETNEHLRNLILVWAPDRSKVAAEFRTHLGLRRYPSDELDDDGS